MESLEEAEAVFSRMLRLNPSDNQEIRFLMDLARAGNPWREARTMDMHTLAAIPAFDWPSDADDHILEVLRDRDALEAERLLAAELAGDVTVLDDVLALALLRILKDPVESDHLRGQVAISFGPVLEEWDMGDLGELDELTISHKLLLRIQASLLELYRDPGTPKYVRRRALEASVRAPEPWHPQAIREAYRNDDPDWKLTAVFCMRFVEGFDGEIVDALDSDNVEILYQAVSAAGSHGVDGAWSYVRRLVLMAASGVSIIPDEPDAEWALLMAAMDAVVSIRPLEAADTLSGLMESEDEELAEAALEALKLVHGYWDEDHWDDEPTWH